MRLAPLFLLLLGGCPTAQTGKPDEHDPYDDDDDGEIDPPCEVFVEETVPASDSTDAYYRADIEFHLSDPDPTATIVTTIPGTQVTS